MAHQTILFLLGVWATAAFAQSAYNLSVADLNVVDSFFPTFTYEDSLPWWFIVADNQGTEAVPYFYFNLSSIPSYNPNICIQNSAFFTTWSHTSSSPGCKQSLYCCQPGIGNSSCPSFSSDITSLYIHSVDWQFIQSWLSQLNSLTWTSTTSASCGGDCYLPLATFSSAGGFVQASGDLYSIPFPPILLQSVIQNYNGQLFFRMQLQMTSGSTITANGGYHYQMSFIRNNTFLNFNYETCVNSACVASSEFGTQSCVCNRGYFNPPNCQQIVCPAVTYDNISFPATWVTSDARTKVTLPCSTTDGYLGSITMLCSAVGSTGNWTYSTGVCIPKTCPQDWTATQANGLNGYAWFNSTTWGTTETGVCIAGFTGTVTRECVLGTNGTVSWAPVSGPCTSLSCPAQSFGGYSWPQTVGGSSASLKCPLGQTGNASLLCQLGGVWSTTIVSSCTPIFCPTQTANAATGLPNLPAGVAANTLGPIGTCPTGWVGSPQQYCMPTGQWDTSNIVNPCQPAMCPPIPGDSVLGNASYSASQAATGVPGVCPSGWTGSPSQTCGVTGSVATWSTQTGSCTPVQCGAVSYNHASWPVTNAGDISVGTCLPGWTAGVSSPIRACTTSGWNNTILNPCIENLCPFESANNVYWPPTVAGSLSTGVCAYGMITPPTQNCLVNATWSGVVSGQCSAATCPATPEFGVSWPLTPVGTLGAPAVANGTCSSNPSVSRLCTFDFSSNQAVWQPLTSSLCGTTFCPALANDSSASWPSTPPSNSVSGTCLPGFQGTVSRSCNSGAWGSISGSCTAASCSQINDSTNHANWPLTSAGVSLVVGSCMSGYQASPTPPIRACDPTGTWSNVISGGCIAVACPSVIEQNAIWPQVFAGGSTNAQCISGWTGTPSRSCDSNGNWQSISNPCTRVTCSSYTSSGSSFSGGVFNVTSVGVCTANYVQNPHGPPEATCQSNGIFSAVTNPCLPVECGNLTESNALWPVSSPGNVTGQCETGWAGSPTRSCLSNGTWGPIANPCTQPRCSSTTIFNANFPSVVAGGVSVGVCTSAGYYGSPRLSCDSSGNWATSVSDPCTRLFCPPSSDPYTIWPLTYAGSKTIVSCVAGFGVGSNNDVRTCQVDGTWDNYASPCTPLFCPATISNNAFWLLTRAGHNSTGTCQSGYTGSSTRLCGIDGQWSTLYVACKVEVFPCPSGTYQNAQWNYTTPGTAANGTCVTGFAGNPQRFCKSDGSWNSTIVDSCVYEIITSTEYIWNVTITSISATDLTMAWQKNSSVVTIQIFLSTDAVNFSPDISGPRTGDTATVSSLLPFTTYYIRMYASLDGSTYQTTGPQLVATTYLDAPTNLQVSNVNTTGFYMTWTSSSIAKFNIVSYRLENSTTPNNFTFFKDVNGSSLNVTGLSPATSYVFKVQTASGTHVDPIGATVNVQTSAVPNANAAFNPTGMIVGIVIAILVLLAALIALTILYRRYSKRREQKALDEYGSQMDIINSNRNATLPKSFLDSVENPVDERMKKGVPRTEIVQGDKTMINTVMEVALPGFLKLDDSQLRREQRLTAGGAGTLFRAELIDHELINRNKGIKIVAFKEVTPWPNLTDAANEERFHQEVSIMWSLSFHPNIIKLVGYTEKPRAIITRLYPTDLYRFLHGQDDKAKLHSAIAFHLSTGIIAGLSAIHSMAIAHRDIKSPNILLAEPTKSEFPDPVICDFGLSRTEDDTAVKKSSLIQGFSPRYAPPEVLSRATNKNTLVSIEDDKSADVYSACVVIWEILERQIPWADMNNEQIAAAVRQGKRLPANQINRMDDFQVALLAAVDAGLESEPKRRPTSAQINSKLLEVYRSRAQF